MNAMTGYVAQNYELSLKDNLVWWWVMLHKIMNASHMSEIQSLLNEIFACFFLANQYFKTMKALISYIICGSPILYFLPKSFDFIYSVRQCAMHGQGVSCESLSNLLCPFSFLCPCFWLLVLWRYRCIYLLVCVPCRFQDPDFNVFWNFNQVCRLP